MRDSSLDGFPPSTPNQGSSPQPSSAHDDTATARAAWQAARPLPLQQRALGRDTQLTRCSPRPQAPRTPRPPTGTAWAPPPRTSPRGPRAGARRRAGPVSTQSSLGRRGALPTAQPPPCPCPPPAFTRTPRRGLRAGRTPPTARPQGRARGAGLSARHTSTPSPRAPARLRLCAEIRGASR